MASSLSIREKSTIKDAFNEGGYVLDFSNRTFESFTIESIGVPIQTKYGGSKGRSFEAYIDDAEVPLSDKIKLLTDLLDRCEDLDLAESPYHRIDANVIAKLRQIAEKYKSSERNHTTKLQADSIKQVFDNEYIAKQIDQMLAAIDQHPSDAIGKAKELVESCCKTILQDRGHKNVDSFDVTELIKEVKKELELSSEHKAIKKIIGGLSGIAGGIAELRNAKGTGHGKGAKFKEPSTIEARLSVDSAIALVHFYWGLHESKSSRPVERS